MNSKGGESSREKRKHVHVNEGAVQFAKMISQSGADELYDALVDKE